MAESADVVRFADIAPTKAITGEWSEGKDLP
jgi:hypothetical protein